MDNSWNIHWILYRTRVSVTTVHLFSNKITLVLFTTHFCSAIPKDKVCESSPIELNIVAYGQWNLGKPTGKDRCWKKV